MENREEINRLLEEIEKKYNVTIIYAVENGSRAYGLHTRNSDYDVRFIYKLNDRTMYDKEIANFEEYMSNKKEEKEVLKTTIPRKMRTIVDTDKSRNIDYQGWELSKSLKLLLKGNGCLIEWIYSPIVYKNDYMFQAYVKNYLRDCNSYNTLMKHYFGFTWTYLHKLKKSFLTDQVEIKPLLGFTRCLCMIIWLHTYFKPKDKKENEFVLKLDLDSVLNDLFHVVGSKVHRLIKTIVANRKNLKDSFKVSREFRLWLLDTFKSYTYITKKMPIQNSITKQNVKHYFKIMFYENIFKYDIYKKFSIM